MDKFKLKNNTIDITLQKAKPKPIKELENVLSLLMI